MNSYGVNVRMAGITAYNDGDIYRCKNEGTISGKASEQAGITALNGGTTSLAVRIAELSVFRPVTVMYTPVELLEMNTVLHQVHSLQ